MTAKILIYPKFKKVAKTEIQTDIDLNEVVTHYSIQFFEAMKNHGITADPKYFHDLAFLREVMKAVLMRTQNKYHSIQDWIDDAFIPELDGEEFDPTNNDRDEEESGDI